MAKRDHSQPHITPTGNPLSVIYCHECPEMWELDRGLRPWITDYDVEKMNSLMFDWGDVISYASTWMSMQEIELCCEASHKDLEWYCMTVFRKSWEECYHALIAATTHDFDETVKKFADEGHSVALSISERRARSREEQRKQELRIKIIKDDLDEED